MKAITSALVLFIGLCCINPCTAQTQLRPAYLDEPVEIRPIGDIKAGENYPLVIYLPFTTGSAEIFYSAVSPYLGLTNYFAIIPKGTSDLKDYLPDFMSYLRWYEQRLMTDLQKILKEYPVDTGRIYLSGYSLGGDLSWALAIRQKELFAGAVIIGSRCSYAPNAKELKYLKEHKKRLVLLMGTEDLPERVKGMVNSYNLAKKNGLAVWHWQFAGEHIIPRDTTLPRAFDILFGRSDGTAGVSVPVPTAAPVTPPEEIPLRSEMLQKH